MERRAFIGALTSALLAAPFAAEAQEGRKVPRIGVLWPNPPATFDWFRRGLSDLGYTEGRNVNFEYRWAEGRLGQLPELAAELVRLKVDVIVALAPPAAQAARNATQTIPIVFVAIGDPVASGLVANFARPGGNLTGTTRMTSEMSIKHMELLKELIPSLSQIAILWNPGNSSHPPALRAIESPARVLRVKPRLLEVKSPEDIESAFTAMGRDRPIGVILLPDPIVFIHLKRIGDLLASSRLPGITLFTAFPKLGGLITYAPSFSDEFRPAATHVHNVLKDALAGDLPVQEPTKFELVIHLKTAKALGLTIPQSLLLRPHHAIDSSTG